MHFGFQRVRNVDDVAAHAVRAAREIQRIARVLQFRQPAQQLRTHAGCLYRALEGLQIRAMRIADAPKLSQRDRVGVAVAKRQHVVRGDVGERDIVDGEDFASSVTMDADCLHGNSSRRR